MSLNYWFFSSTIALILFTIQDYTNNRNVDDRRNWIMLGLSISLLSHLQHNIFYIIGVSLICFLLNIGLTRFKLIGEADINTLTWLFMGISFIRIDYLVLFNVIFCVLTLSFILLKRFLFKKKENTAFYGVFLISWALFCLIYFRS